MPVATAGVPPMGSMGAVAAMAVPPAAPGQYGEMTTKVMLPNSKVGAVIGKQGTVIKAIRDNSGAKVNISETVAGQTERVVRRAARRVHSCEAMREAGRPCRRAQRHHHHAATIQRTHRADTGWRQVRAIRAPGMPKF